jgi:uncharacterized protein (TIGR03435 family)
MGMNRRLISLPASLISLCATALIAQSPAPAASRPAFEVAAVRPNTSGTNQVSIGIQPGGRFTAVNVPLIVLIRIAHRLQESQLVGAPDWVVNERYDISAKAEAEFSPAMPGGPAGLQQLMLQSLLEDRFKLMTRRETREMPIFALVLARADGKLGPQIKPSATDCQAMAAARRGGPPPGLPQEGERPVCGMRMGFGQLAGGGFPLSQLASSLSQTVQRVVIDKTGLSGNFDFDLKWTPDQLPQGPPPPGVTPPSIDPNGPSIFTAVQEQLGLKLDSQRGPVEVLVIDHVERPTAD